jgi:hypothetical protein
MTTSEIIAQIDSQIADLQKCKSILLGSETKRKVGRPKKLHIDSVKAVSSAIARPKRKMSAASRARIATAQKARWVKSKKAAKKATPVQDSK